MLVTGGTGFTGSHTAAALAAAGHQVRLMVRDPAKVGQVFPLRGYSPDDVVVADMTDGDAVEAAFDGCHGVIHTAAVVDLRRRSARAVEEANTRGVEIVVGGAVRRGIPSIVHVSSLSVFLVRNGPPMSASSPIVDGASAYARSKAAAERYVRGLQDARAPVGVCYPAGIIGPDDPGLSAMTAGLKSFMTSVFVLTSGGMQIVDVRDLAALLVTLLELPPGPHRYVAASPMLSWSLLYDLCCTLTGTHPRRIRVPGAVLRAAGSVGDVVKRLYDFDFPLTREGMDVTTGWPGADASATTRELGITFRDPAETLRDTLRWLFVAGHLTADQAGTLAQEAMSP